MQRFFINYEQSFLSTTLQIFWTLFHLLHKLFISWHFLQVFIWQPCSQRVLPKWRKNRNLATKSGSGYFKVKTLLPPPILALFWSMAARQKEKLHSTYKGLLEVLALSAAADQSFIFSGLAASCRRQPQAKEKLRNRHSRRKHCFFLNSFFRFLTPSLFQVQTKSKTRRKDWILKVYCYQLHTQQLGQELQNYL